MEDLFHDYKCACLGINILGHITTVDHRIDIATDDRNGVFMRLLGM